MPSIADVTAKVQRILANNFSVRLGPNGSFIISYESANVLIAVEDGLKKDDSALVVFRVPLVKKVPLTPALYQWVATDGQNFRIGGVIVLPDHSSSVGDVWFRYSIVGDDLDESELLAAVYVLLKCCDEIDNDIQSRFGGEVFGE